MSPKAPDWVGTVWSGRGWMPATGRAALAPLELAFRAASRAHHALYDHRVRAARTAPVPVISVGNLRVGGSGKTPFAGWLVERLLDRGCAPALLHGGYGDDEPELHRRWHPDVPVLVGRDRAASARTAQEQGRDVVVLDDAFQHRRLARDLDIVLVAAEHLRAPVRLLPAGPWREPLSALGRAQLVVVTRRTASAAEAADAADRLRRHTADAPARVWLRPERLVRHGGDWKGAARGGPSARGVPREAVAVAGIADPALFFQNVRQAGVRLTDTLSFPDHHDYDAGDAGRMDAAAGGRPIVTTAKDAVKLESLPGPRDLWVLEQAVVVEQGGALIDRRLDEVLS